MPAEIQHFYHQPSGTLSYVVSDAAAAAVIDPVLGFSVVSGKIDSGPADAILDYLGDHGLALQWILETHAHADHLTAAQYIKSRLGGTVAIGHGIVSVQEHFGKLFNLKAPFSADGHQFDHLFADNEEFRIGDIQCRVLATPGHTSDSVSYRVEDAVFVGDSLFMPDFGTARCDFPGGDANQLFDSIQRLLALPDETRLFMCHDYPPESRELRFEISVAEQKEKNIHVGGDAGKQQYVAIREQRDANLSLPALILPSIQVNICAGQLPQAEDNDISYIRIPLDRL